MCIRDRGTIVRSVWANESHGHVRPRPQPSACALYQASHDPLVIRRYVAYASGTAAGTSSHAVDLSRAGQLRSPSYCPVSASTPSATRRNTPDTRTEHAPAASSAAHTQRPSRARTHAQNANAANRLSVYGTTVNTAVGANSHRAAATTPTRGCLLYTSDAAD